MRVTVPEGHRYYAKRKRAMNQFPCSGCGSRLCDGECFVEDKPENEEIKKMLLSPDTQDTEELIRVTPEMLEAWTAWEPGYEPTPSLTVRQCAFVRHAFYAGWIASRPDSPVTVIREALAVRDAAAAKCPIQSGRYQAVCPRCSATDRESCGLITHADYVFVEAAREALARISR